MLRVRLGLSISQEARERYFLKHEVLKNGEGGRSCGVVEVLTCEARERIESVKCKVLQVLEKWT